MSIGQFLVIVGFLAEIQAWQRPDGLLTSVLKISANFLQLTGWVCFGLELLHRFLT